MSLWLKLAAGLAKSVYTQHRAKSRLSQSVSGEEQVLRQVGAQLWSSIFNHQTGILAITTRAVRFEITLGTTGRPATGSVVIPLDDIREVWVEPGVIWNGKVVLETASGRKAFLMSRGRAEEVKELIQQARSEA